MDTSSQWAAIVLGVVGASLVAHAPAKAVSLGGHEGWQTVRFDFANGLYRFGEAISFNPRNVGPAVTISSFSENRKGIEKASAVTVIPGLGLGVISGRKDSWALDNQGRSEKLRFLFGDDYTARVSKVVLSGIQGNEHVVINDSLTSDPGKVHTKFKQYSSTKELEDSSFEFEASGGGLYIKKVVFELFRRPDSFGQYSSTKPVAASDS